MVFGVFVDLRNALFGFSVGLVLTVCVFWVVFLPRVGFRFDYVVIWLCFGFFGFDLLVCGFVVLGSIRSVCAVMVEILVFDVLGSLGLFV